MLFVVLLLIKVFLFQVTRLCLSPIYITTKGTLAPKILWSHPVFLSRPSLSQGIFSSILCASPSAPGLHQHILLGCFPECQELPRGLVPAAMCLSVAGSQAGKADTPQTHRAELQSVPARGRNPARPSQRFTKCCLRVTLRRGSITLIIRESMANYIILFKIIPVRHNVYGAGNVSGVTAPDVGSAHCPG